MHNILWLDNDEAQTTAYVNALTRTGNTVKVVTRISECERLLNESQTSQRYDLLILDVMIPTRNEEEEKKYDPSTTERGMATGLAIFREWSARLETMGTKVLALTARLDRTLREKFAATGLPREAFATKFDLRDSREFLARVSKVIGIPSEH
jgi:CheY-like chemotaxis protein